MYGPHIAGAAACLVLVDVGLTLLGHARLRRLLRIDATNGASSREEVAVVLERTVRAFAWVSARYPRSRCCLAQALALQRLLARRGIPVDVRIGVRREGRAIAGHAWVELAGRPLAERRDPRQRFVVLRSAVTMS